MKFSRSLKARLLALVILAALPVALAMAYMAFNMREAALSDAKNGLMTVVKDFVQEQSQLRVAAQQALRTLSRIPEVTSDGRHACNTALARIVAGEGLFYNFGVIDLEGTVTCSGHPLPGSVNVADRGYFERAINTRVFAVGSYTIGRVTRQPSMQFVLPILDDNGEPRAVLYAILLLSKVLAPIGIASLPRDAIITLIDPEFTVLTRSPPDMLIGRNVTATALHKAIVANRSDLAVISSTGLHSGKRIHAFARIRDSSEIVGYAIVSVPESVVVAPADRALIGGLVVLLLVVGAMSAVIYLGANAFVLRRVDALLRATRRIAAGDLAARMPTRADVDEFGTLETAFNDMATKTESHVQQISSLNRTYAMLTGISSASTRIRERETLLQEICRIAVEAGGYGSACIFMVDEQRQAARLAAHAGADRDHYEALEIRVGVPVEPGDGPLHRALNTGEQSIEHAPRESAPGAQMSRVLRRIDALGGRAVAAFPLAVEGRTVGALQLWSGNPRAFDDEELLLLQQLAADLDLALENLDREERLYELSNFDPVTRLPNRNLFEDRVAQAIARAPREERVVGVAALRVGRFLGIVNSFGRAGADDVLRTVTRHIAKELRPGDTVARTGEDQFGIVLADVPGIENIVTTANRLMTAFPRSVRWAGHDVLTYASMGTAVFPSDGADAQTLIAHAELALNNTTSSRLNSHAFYAPELEKHATERRQLEGQLVQALERNEFSLVYQPVVRIRDKHAVGAEALLRWNNRLLGPISPALFVPLSEQIGLMTRIGAWVFETAIRQRIAWRAHVSPQFRISVNVSPVQLRSPDFLPSVRGLLEQSRFDPHEMPFGVELTESELIENINRELPTLTGLREMGIQLAIDDFGTGYSSLSYLRHLPVDVLKIDTSFVREIAADASARSLAKSIVALGQSLGLHTVAEGVETEEQFALLTEMGCDLAQGYLFSKPVPAEEFAGRFLKPGNELPAQARSRS